MQQDYYHNSDISLPDVKVDDNANTGDADLTGEDVSPLNLHPEDDVKPGALRTISNILSAVFSPLLVPTYAYAIVMWTTRMSIVPERVRLTSTLIIFLITAIIPFGVILYLIRTGRVSGPALGERKERAVPYLLTIICYFFAAWCLWNLPHWVPMFFVGAGIAAFISSCINIVWKISAHATAMGGLCAIVVFIGITGLSTVMLIPWLSTTIIISGAVCSARLYLRRHTQGQVFAGWILGFIVTEICLFC